MKKFLTTIVSGFIGIVFPLVMVIFLLEKLHHLISPVVLAIESTLQITRFLGVLGIVLISAVLMILLGYLCGLLIRSPWIKRQIEKLDEKLLSKIPLYNLIQSLIVTEAGVKGKGEFRPALLADERAFSLCYVTGKSDHFYSVYVSEGGLSGGELRIVPKETVRLLNISLQEFTRLVKQYGVDSAHYAELFVNSPQNE